MVQTIICGSSVSAVQSDVDILVRRWRNRRSGYQPDNLGQHCNIQEKNRVQTDRHADSVTYDYDTRQIF
ncbi:MAG: hypothetical protein AAF639_20215 [Chloroflexota bacterium]